MDSAAPARTSTSSPFESAPKFELCIVYAKKKSSDDPKDAVQYYISRLRDKGLLVEEESGIDNVNFIKIAAPVELIGHAAETLRIKKATYFGLDVTFAWDQRDAFIRQAYDNCLFNWTERYRCLDFLIHNVLNDTGSTAVKFTLGDDKSEYNLQPGEDMLASLRNHDVVKDIFPLHDETMRKELFNKWATNWRALTAQPIDAIHSYFGAKVAIYFAFLEMYTQWLVFPALLALYFYFRGLGKWGPVIPVMFSMLAVIWSVLFLQFWKRKNAALLTRWGMTLDSDEGKEELDVDFPSNSEQAGIQSGRIHETPVTKYQKQMFQKSEWMQQLKSFRNYAVVITGIMFVQLPFELAYAHLNKVLSYDILKYVLTVTYLLAIQYFTQIGGKVAVKLTKTETYTNKEAEADGLIYKLFGIYFMQSYIGLLYHALFHRDFTVLRQFLVQRLIIAQIMSNVSENIVPYATYLYAKHKACKAEEEHKKLSGEKPQQASSVEKEYMRSPYNSSIGSDLEDGLFDDFLELALQFGMVTMFACSFPLVFVFALVNNVVEIRSDAIKLLSMLRRPVPREASSIGAWLKIFQYLGVVAICTNCALLVCLYDEAGQWNVEPGLAAILIMEHLLLLAKFGFACFVPEEPAWVKAKRTRKARVQEHYAMQILRNVKHADLS